MTYVRKLDRWFLLLALALALAPGWACAEETRWEYLPYQVQVFTCVAPACGFSAEFDKELQRGLTAQAETQLGGAWQLECAAAPANLAAAAVANLDELPPEKLRAASGANADKVFLVVVDVTPQGYRARAREYDVATGQFGRPAEQKARQPALVVAAAADALFAAFTPLAHVEMPRTGSVVLRLRAGRLVPSEGSPAAAPPQSLFRPFLPVKPQEGDAAARLEPIPWTYVEVVGPAEGHLHGRLISGAADALPAKTHYERLAAMVKPTGKSTEVRLLANDIVAAGQPLAGYELSERTAPEGPLVSLGATNAQGVLVIPASNRVLRDIYVTSGAATLAHVPLAPGFLPVETVVLADDGPRREAEGFLSAFEGRILDLVAQRAELVQRAKRRLAESKRGEAEAVARQLRALPSKEQLVTALEQGRRRIEPTQGAVREQVAQMFRNAREQLDFYLDRNPLDELPGLKVAP